MFGLLKAGGKGKIVNLSQVGLLVQRRLLDLGITVGSDAFAIAYVLSLIIYQGGKLFGLV